LRESKGKRIINERKLTGYPSIDEPWLKYYSEEAIYIVSTYLRRAR